MSKKPVKDVFGLWQIEMLESGEFAGKYDFPLISGTSKVPEILIPFSMCAKELDTQNKAVHFYELDEKFVSCLDSKAKITKKLEIFKRYKCIILPDFSIYRDMPLSMQIFQTYKSRAVGAFLEHNGIKVIPNIRWGDERTYEFAFDGIEKWGVVAVGTLGAYGDKINTNYFENGFIKMLEELDPETVLCYGNISDGLKNECSLRKINVIIYPTEISKRTQSSLHPSLL